MMFDFLSMSGNYEDRKVSNTVGKDIEGNEFVLDTAMVTDSVQPYETALQHPLYNDNLWVILESYDTKEESLVGHTKWVELFTTKKLPESITDHIVGGFEDFMDDKSIKINRKEVVEDLKNKELPFEATVNGDSLDCYDWENGDRLQIIKLVDDLDAEHNEYLWKAINLDRNNEAGGVSTYQITF